MHEYPKQTESDIMIIWGTMEGQMLIKIWAIFGNAKIRRSKLKKIAQWLNHYKGTLICVLDTWFPKNDIKSEIWIFVSAILLQN